jgi:dephospho-CoA kinase
MIVGITGRIGSGKSTFGRFLARRFGCPLLDADELGHEALRTDPRIQAAVRERFGPGILDLQGGIDRARLGSLVFPDAGARHDLNWMVHPWIVERILARVAALREQGDAGIVLIDAALLLDWIDRLPCDRIVVVRCSEETALRRLAGRGITEADARRRLASQDPEERFLRHADFVIENDGDPGALEEQAVRLWQSLSRGGEEIRR